MHGISICDIDRKSLKLQIYLVSTIYIYKQLRFDLQNFKLNSTGDLADHNRIVLTMLF